MAPSFASPAGDSAYRPEIDGLRAIAVAAAILFHAELPGFSAGYLGVDIFFAISGFLITDIIVRECEGGRFSLRQFYMRRIRRILPALLVMCLLTIPLAWLVMMPEYLENHGQALVATALSVNNVLLYLTSGYFHTDATFKPLFHTWSLGVEEQYYALVPLLLLLAMRWRGRAGAVALLAALSLASLLLCELIRWRDLEANFLMLPSRFWELGLGGLTALLRPQWLGLTNPALRRAGAALGLAMVLASLAWLTPDYALPGWQSLLPVVGTCLILGLGDRSGVGRLLALPPMVGLGLISYSAYLYHAPLFAFLRLTSLEPLPTVTLLAAIPVALGLAWLSWRFVERPFRDRARTSDRAVLRLCGAGMAVVIGLGLMWHLTGGMFASSSLAKTDPELGYQRTADYNERPRRYQDRPFASADRARNVLVIGNSFARDFINMGLENGHFARVNLSYAELQNCDALPPEVQERIGQAQAVVLASGIAEDDLLCVQKQIALLERKQVPNIVVIGTKQFGFNNNAVMLLPESERYRYRAKVDPHLLESNSGARTAISGRYYVDLFALLDDGSGTVPLFTPQRGLISQDHRHLTSAGARFLGEKVFAQPQFSWLQQPGS